MSYWYQLWFSFSIYLFSCDFVNYFILFHVRLRVVMKFGKKHCVAQRYSLFQLFANWVKITGIDARLRRRWVTCVHVRMFAISYRCTSENTTRKRYIQGGRGTYEELVEGGRRKVLGARSYQDLRFIMYNVQEREGEPYLFPLYWTPASRFFLLAPYPSGFLYFLFLFLSPSCPLTCAHARGRFIGLCLCPPTSRCTTAHEWLIRLYTCARYVNRRGN